MAEETEVRQSYNSQGKKIYPLVTINTILHDENSMDASSIGGFAIAKSLGEDGNKTIHTLMDLSTKEFSVPSHTDGKNSIFIDYEKMVANANILAYGAIDSRNTLNVTGSGMRIGYLDDSNQFEERGVISCPIDQGEQKKYAAIKLSDTIQNGGKVYYDLTPSAMEYKASSMIAKIDSNGITCDNGHLYITKDGGANTLFAVENYDDIERVYTPNHLYVDGEFHLGKSATANQETIDGYGIRGESGVISIFQMEKSNATNSEIQLGVGSSSDSTYANAAAGILLSSNNGGTASVTMKPYVNIDGSIDVSLTAHVGGDTIIGGNLHAEKNARIDGSLYIGDSLYTKNLYPIETAVYSIGSQNSIYKEAHLNNIYVYGSRASQNRRITSDAVNNIYVDISDSIPLVIEPYCVRRGYNSTETILGASQYPWKEIYGTTYNGTTYNGQKFVASNGTFTTTYDWNSLIAKNGNSSSEFTLQQGGGDTIIGGNVYPIRSVGTDLGSSQKRWRNIYGNTLDSATISARTITATERISTKSIDIYDELNVGKVDGSIGKINVITSGGYNPSISLRRGSTIDNYTDWTIINDTGDLYITSSYGSVLRDCMRFSYNGDVSMYNSASVSSNITVGNNAIIQNNATINSGLTVGTNSKVNIQGGRIELDVPRNGANQCIAQIYSTPKTSAKRHLDLINDGVYIHNGTLGNHGGYLRVDGNVDIDGHASISKGIATDDWAIFGNYGAEGGTVSINWVNDANRARYIYIRARGTNGGNDRTLNVYLSGIEKSPMIFIEIETAYTITTGAGGSISVNVYNGNNKLICSQRSERRYQNYGLWLTVLTPSSYNVSHKIWSSQSLYTQS